MTISIIAGGTSGIGLSIAEALLQQEANEVFLIGRNAHKGGAVEASLNTSHPGRAHFVELDLSDIGAVAAFAAEFVSTHDELDLFAHTAGVMEPERRLTPEGFEKTFAVGYLSAFVLARDLAPLLDKARHGRIANVAGVERFIINAKLDFDDLTFSQGYGSFKAAITTVHAKTVLTEILAAKYAARQIDVLSFHPGAVRSDLMKNMPWWKRLLFAVPSLFMSKHSATGIRVCTDPALNGTSGKYVTDKKVVALGFDEDYKQRLWSETERLLDAVASGRIPAERSARPS